MYGRFLQCCIEASIGRFSLLYLVLPFFGAAVVTALGFS